MKVIPLNDKILVERVEAEEKTAGGIVLPDTAKEKPKQGKILELGEGKVLENGKRATPQPVVGLPTGVAVTAIAGGESHTLAALADGRLYAWGRGTSGQLGGDNCPAPLTTNNYCPNNSLYGNRATPQLVPTNAGYLPDVPVVAVAAGKGLSAGTFSLAVLANGTVYAWGSDNGGQLGDGCATGWAPYGEDDTITNAIGDVGQTSTEDESGRDNGQPSGCRRISDTA